MPPPPQVSNLTISRPGVGQVRWVVPIDVRGLGSLAEVVSLEPGEVSLYPDASAKPPPGSGLNQPAEVTLYGVYKKDKATGALIKDGPRAQVCAHASVHVHARACVCERAAVHACEIAPLRV